MLSFSQQHDARNAVLARSSTCCLKVIFVISGNDHIVDLQDHPTKLGGQEQLLSFPYQRVDDEMFSHILYAVSERLDTCHGRVLTIASRLHAVHT